MKLNQKRLLALLTGLVMLGCVEDDDNLEIQPTIKTIPCEWPLWLFSNQLIANDEKGQIFNS